MHNDDAQSQCEHDDGTEEEFQNRLDEEGEECQNRRHFKECHEVRREPEAGDVRCRREERNHVYDDEGYNVGEPTHASKYQVSSDKYQVLHESQSLFTSPFVTIDV